MKKPLDFYWCAYSVSKLAGHSSPATFLRKPLRLEPYQIFNDSLRSKSWTTRLFRWGKSAKSAEGCTEEEMVNHALPMHRGCDHATTRSVIHPPKHSRRRQPRQWKFPISEIQEHRAVPFPPAFDGRGGTIRQEPRACLGLSRWSIEQRIANEERSRFSRLPFTIHTIRP